MILECDKSEQMSVQIGGSGDRVPPAARVRNITCTNVGLIVNLKITNGDPKYLC